MSDTSAVEEYWGGVSQRLQIEADVLNRLVSHNGEMGRANEIALAQLLSNLLPASVGVGTGVVIDAEGRRSAQSDVIVYDRSMQPQLLAQTTQLLFPIETVIAVIEVKTSVDAKAIKDLGEKCAKLAQLKDSRNDVPRPPVGLFGYNCMGAPATRAAELLALQGSQMPDLACVVQPGIVARYRRGQPLSVGFVPLHRKVDGVRQSLSWARPSDQAKGGFAFIDGSLYPISRFKASSRERYLFEPGRALLMFCADVLDVLAERGKVGSDWLSAYLPGVASETQTFTA